MEYQLRDSESQVSSPEGFPATEGTIVANYPEPEFLIRSRYLDLVGLRGRVALWLLFVSGVNLYPLALLVLGTDAPKLGFALILVPIIMIVEGVALDVYGAAGLELALPIGTVDPRFD